MVKIFKKILKITLGKLFHHNKEHTLKTNK